MAVNSMPPLPPKTTTAEKSISESLRECELRRGRKFYEQRPLFFVCGVSASASGSCFLVQGPSRVLVTVVGPRPVESGRQAQQMQSDSEHGSISIELTFAANAMPTEYMENQRLPAQSRGAHDARQREECESLANFLQEGCDSTVLTDQFQGANVEIAVLVISADIGNIRAVASTAVSLALANAQVPLKDITSAVNNALFVHQAPAQTESADPMNTYAEPSYVLVVDPSQEEIAQGFCVRQGEIIHRYICEAVLHMAFNPADRSVAVFLAHGKLSNAQLPEMVRLAESTATELNKQLRFELKRTAAAAE